MFPKPPEASFGCLLEAFRNICCDPRRRVCSVTEKVLPRIVFRCESQRASIAKTSKPYRTSSENREWAHDGVPLPT